jgi:hypothetical protein
MQCAQEMLTGAVPQIKIFTQFVYLAFCIIVLYVVYHVLLVLQSSIGVAEDVSYV